VEGSDAEFIRVEASVAFDGIGPAKLAGREAGLDIEITGATFLESEAPPLHLLFNFDPLQLAAGYALAKIADGALGEVGAAGMRVLGEALRRIPIAAKRFAEHVKDRRTMVSVRVTGAGGQPRLYPLNMKDMDEATLAILEDLGVPVDDRANADRAWVDKRWVGMRDYWDDRERESRARRGRAPQDGGEGLQ
jgi:hypothetical protein